MDKNLDAKRALLSVLSYAPSFELIPKAFVAANILKGAKDDYWSNGSVTRDNHTRIDKRTTCTIVFPELLCGVGKLGAPVISQGAERTEFNSEIIVVENWNNNTTNIWMNKVIKAFLKREPAIRNQAGRHHEHFVRGEMIQLGKGNEIERTTTFSTTWLSFWLPFWLQFGFPFWFQFWCPR